MPQLNKVVIPDTGAGKTLVLEERSDGDYDVKIYAADGGTVNGDLIIAAEKLRNEPMLNVSQEE